MIEMLIFAGYDPYINKDFGFLVSDETCMTVCPNNENDLWYLTEWRIISRASQSYGRKRFEQVTWGEVRREREVKKKMGSR